MTSATEMRSTFTPNNSLIGSPVGRKKREKLHEEHVFTSAENSESDIDYAATILPDENPKEMQMGRSLHDRQVDDRIKDLEAVQRLFRSLRSDDNKSFESILQKNPHLANQTDERGNTVLIEALSRNNRIATTLLLKADPLLKSTLPTTIPSVVACSNKDLRPLILDLIDQAYIDCRSLLPHLLVTPKTYMSYKSNITQDQSLITMAKEIVITFQFDAHILHSLCKNLAKQLNCSYGPWEIREINKHFGFPEQSGIQKHKCNLL